MIANYDDVLAQLQAAGLQVTNLEVGRIIRCRVEGEREKEKRGWYSLHEVTGNGGEQLLIGTFGVWRGIENNAQKIELKRQTLTPDQMAAARKRLAEERKRAEHLRAALAKKAADKAAAVWGKLQPIGESDYLIRKGVHAHGLRFSPSGALAVPMQDNVGRIHGLQIIRGSKRAKGELEKQYYPAGVAIKGHYHLIGVPSGVVVVVEGYATGATVFEAGGGAWAVAVAFDAGNMRHVAAALHKRYSDQNIIAAADDDIFQTCIHCKARLVLSANPETCPACGEPHKRSNTGVMAAEAAAMQVGGAWLKPQFADQAAREAAFLEHSKKLSDFNDLHATETLGIVRDQILAVIKARGWGTAARGTSTPTGQGDKLRPIETVGELLDRFSLVYGQRGTVFDHQEHCLIALTDLQHACSGRYAFRAWSESPNRSIVRMSDVGFDPSGKDSNITCNLWGGWPTTPQAGECGKLLQLLEHMCSAERNAAELYDWVLKWLAYPIQHPGAKMQTTLVLHGPQGTGKNMFFETIMSIYGSYGRIIDQNAVEDRFNEWASKKLFLIADEVVARSDLYHIKNKLKAFITGEWIRINPKNIAAYDERNHVNIVFLSNESMPVVLEEDDRRHAVIWTPAKLAPEFYAEVRAEIDAGGVAALHHYLLEKVDCSKFHESTKPPITEAKEELIGLSWDSPTRFFYELAGGELVKDFHKFSGPALSQDVYDFYRLWCNRQGNRAAPMNKLVNALARKHRIIGARKRYLIDDEEFGPHNVLFIGKESEPPPGENEKPWLGRWINKFKMELKDYRGLT